MQLDAIAASGSQSQQKGPSQASAGATINAKGRPDVLAQQAAGRSLSRLGSVAVDLKCGHQTPNHSRPQQLQIIPEVRPISGRQTAHLDQAACSERSAQGLSYPHSMTPQAQRAKASAPGAVQDRKQLHSQHAASAAPANAAQHLMPEAQDRRGHINLYPKEWSTSLKQGSPGYLTPGARLEASQISQHASAGHGPQQSGSSAATRCMSNTPGGAAQTPGAMSGPQPRPAGPMDITGRPAQVSALPSSMQPRHDRQAPAAVVALHRQQQGSYGPSGALVHRLAGNNAGAATAPGVGSQGWPGQQMGHTHAGVRHAGTCMPAEAGRQPGTLPLQHSGVQIPSMATAQPREQQQHSSSPVKALVGQHQTALQSSTAALAAVPHRASPQSHGVAGHALMGKLPLNVMQAWVRRDLEAARAHLEATTEVGSHAVFLSLFPCCRSAFVLFTFMAHEPSGQCIHTVL